ncbi:MAG TPA: hypothetical protein VGK19_18740 [Capsulimonadaceae bacterium]|jgi:hypothetical protein
MLKYLTRRELIQGGAVAVAGLLAGTALLTFSESAAFADDADPAESDDVFGASRVKKCPTCGCTHNHCDTGVPEHLACTAATPEQKEALDKRRKDIAAAYATAQKSGETLCHRAVNSVMLAIGYHGFKYAPPYQAFADPKGMSAAVDDMMDFLTSPRARREGWVPVKGAAICNYANAGWLVVGGIKYSDVIDIKDSATVFVVTGGKSGGDWKAITALDAGKGHTPRIEPASNIVASDSRGGVKFFALKAIYENGVLVK